MQCLQGMRALPEDGLRPVFDLAEEVGEIVESLGIPAGGGAGTSLCVYTRTCCCTVVSSSTPL